MSDVERLAGACAALLDQAHELAGRLDAAAYARPGPAGSASVGAHLRHCLESFECFLAGLPRGAVDYDARPRALRLERDPRAAQERIAALRRTFADEIAERPDAPLAVRADEPELAPDRGFVASSLARELRALASHTVHHFAIVALLLRLEGIAVDPSLGVAPSTWAHWRRAG